MIVWTQTIALLEEPVFETIAFLSTVTMAGIFTFLVVMHRRAGHDEENHESK
jgi:hypothetical protein